jgi:hypothetical protein
MASTASESPTKAKRSRAEMEADDRVAGNQGAAQAAAGTAPQLLAHATSLTDCV